MGIFLNVGCGTRKLPDFINVDREPGGDLQIDVVRGLPFASSSVEGIYSEHFIEHLSQREGVTFLRECRRVLVPGGRLRIATPDLDQLVWRYRVNWRRQAWIHDFGYEWIDNRCESLNMALREWGHQWVYDQEELTRLAWYAGLSSPKRWALGASDQPVFRGLEWRKDSSLIMEFVKQRPAVAKDDPLVSVLIPAYHPAYHRQALESALKQTYSPLEIVICDDSPSDEIGRIVKEYSSSGRPIRYVRNRSRVGARENYVKCFGLARGDYVKFLNDDDFLEPTCVARMVRCLSAFPDVTLVTSHRQCVDGSGTFLPEMRATQRPVERDSLVEGVSMANAVLATGINFIGEPTTVLFRKQDLEGAKPDIVSFARRNIWNVDVAMWLNLLSRGDAIYLVDTLSYFRLHSAQQSNEPGAFQTSMAVWDHHRYDGMRFGLFDPNGAENVMARPLPSC